MIIAGLAMAFRGKFWESWEGWEDWESWESWESWEGWEGWEHWESWEHWEGWENCGDSCCHRLCAAFLLFYLFTFLPLSAFSVPVAR